MKTLEECISRIESFDFMPVHLRKIMTECVVLLSGHGALPTFILPVGTEYISIEYFNPKSCIIDVYVDQDSVLIYGSEGWDLPANKILEKLKEVTAQAI